DIGFDFDEFVPQLDVMQQQHLRECSFPNTRNACYDANVSLVKNSEGFFKTGILDKVFCFLANGFKGIARNVLYLFLKYFFEDIRAGEPEFKGLSFDRLVT